MGFLINIILYILKDIYSYNKMNQEEIEAIVSKFKEEPGLFIKLCLILI